MSRDTPQPLPPWLAELLPFERSMVDVGGGVRMHVMQAGPADGLSVLLWGVKDPILGRLLRRTARALPQAPVTETGAGHFLQEEVPDEIAEAIAGVATKVRATADP